MGGGTISLRTFLSREIGSQSWSRQGGGRRWKLGRGRALEGRMGVIQGSFVNRVSGSDRPQPSRTKELISTEYLEAKDLETKAKVGGRRVRCPRSLSWR